MLDNETKRRIDTARDILVGKLPDPKSQVEQITIALIYKFMDDMDAQSVEFDGDPSFFVGEYEKYGWRKLFAPNLSGHERLALYGEAIVNLNQNPHLPQLFRDIFKNAYLPYRDPETLTLFLKTINEFKYDHSERLGDAFEYLLSVLGSQGDAGQFRTPRHIIDFIVKTLAPKKNETVCDPACGTAGFLISSYKYILENNKRNTPGDTLTPDERRRLMTNFVGYDISPDMVRLSLVNLYLHGFPSPTIHEYDSLTSEDRWNETFDIVMANPPFMSPKGGIKPHKKFSIAANRSEVLFVDYIAEHIHPTHGRAGIIVPEGIIFQSAGAYRDLRKMLVDKAFLYAVVSLPAGVFQPYSGVKTSILLMDKTIAAKTDKILFVKIQNDGFGLGAQRRELATSDLPDALNLIRDFQQAVLQGETSRFAGEDLPLQAVAVEKTQIAANGDYNLSGDRYKTAVIRQHKFETVEVGELCEKILSGGTPSTENKEFWNGEIAWITSADISNLKTAIPRKFITQKAIAESATNLIPKGNIIVVTRVGLGKLFLNDFDVCISQDSQGLVLKKDKVLPEFLLYALYEKVQDFKNTSQGTTIQGVTKNQLSSIKIPLPQLSIQKEIVEKIEGFQRIIDGAKQVVENYKPQIDISPDWEMVELGEVCENLDSQRKPVTSSDRIKGIYPYYGASGIVDYVDNYIFDGEYLLVSEDGANLLARVTPIAFSVSGKVWVNNHAHILRFDEKATQTFIELYLNSISLDNYVTGSAQPKLNQANLNSIKIPLPPLEVQQEIVAHIEREQSLVNSNKELITIFETKIKDEINKLWEE
ncbi:MAG TPA: restriction endonuclease subunit S [Pyrinomonadaceae bacterium]|jgi:type I restriction enzyme M protein